MTDHKAPGGASPATLPVDAFAYEVLHGAHLCIQLYEAALQEMAYVGLRKRYDKLDRAIESANSALNDLYQIAGEVWHAEAKRAEAGDAPTGA